MATKKRVTRKELLNEPDEFITLTGKAVRWSREHERELYTALVIASMVVLIVMGWSFFASRSEKKAGAMFIKAQEQYWSQLQRSTPGEAALSAFKQFQGVANEYPGTSGGRLGAVMAAQTAFDSGDYDAAVQWGEKALKAYKGDPLVTSQLLLALAYAHEEKDQYDRAAECFSRVLDMEPAVGQEDAALGLARVYENQGEVQQSLEAYKRFLDEFPDSAMAGMAKEKLAGEG